ncbi:hypothetical protein F4553_003755 [Allocatelliglobosispora scoriae]|uniref:Protein-glutamine gamma-glutamyltransferase-like C-terminal domain-containing protein n=1 Tax=Allocatelliglobosispora scoriae TaxID=643052 RepID=A0A841BSK4_9ACTN|nr:DUF4129 domain-containing protein [Allocatelliglobosispora scoriae]MBB5870376.1 hypothetical protein [Allocatelliglobosispora scoriae]
MGVLRRWLPLAAVAVLLGVVGLGAVLGSLPVRPADLGSGAPPSARPTLSQPPIASEGGPGDPGSDVEMPGWIGTAAGALCLTLVVIVVGLLIFQLLRQGAPRKRWARLLMRTPSRAPKPLSADSVVAALDEGIQALDDDDADPRRAVIACWVRLESAAAAAGTARQPGDTSTDLVVRLLEGQRVSAPVLTGFAAVYREARYGHHVVDETMRAQARAALRQLRADLTAEVPA